MNNIIIVQGAQYGSEAKGQIAHVICEREGVDIAVRTGATNAGHTVYHDGEAVKFQQLPVAALIPGVELVLGAGALIDLEILDAEVQLASKLTGDDVRKRLLVDPRAWIHERVHAERSHRSDRHVTMGATGKGCSEALVDRISNRGTGRGRQFRDIKESADYAVDDTERFLNHSYDGGAKILLEGTQGQGLDLYLGPYPYVTHKQCGPAQWLLEAGLSPNLPLDIVMVVRTYPIRVAGNSGPMRMETSWPNLARDINRKLGAVGRAPLVTEDSLRHFEAAVREMAKDYYLPRGLTGLDQHLWDADQRVRYRVALSELHARAIGSLPDHVVADLRRLFEFTTVTKKLRRIAKLDVIQLDDAFRQIRPSRVALTFANYQFPEHWTDHPTYYSDQVTEYIMGVSCYAPVSYVGWGPAPQHVKGGPV